MNPFLAWSLALEHLLLRSLVTGVIRLPAHAVKLCQEIINLETLTILTNFIAVVGFKSRSAEERVVLSSVLGVDEVLPLLSTVDIST